MLDVLPGLYAAVDEPFADASILPTYLLAQFTRRTVTVALGGDGSDELLAGYPTFGADRLARWYRVPRLLHERAAVPLANLLPVSTDNFSLDFKLKRFLRGARAPEDVRHGVWLGSFPPDEIDRLLVAGPVGTDPYEGLRTLWASAPGSDALSRLIFLYVKTYLTDDILVKTDRASMLNSLEVRAPFLDHTLVEFLGSVPSSLKLRRFTTKHLLKRAVRDLLPGEIADRPKKGFGIPLAAWLKGELREPLLDELSPERLRRQGIFDPAEVTRLVTEHLDGRRDNRKELWTLFAFQLWHRGYGAAS
jgi:asparagine synthase (glutamine-hydrolysing)